MRADDDPFAWRGPHRLADGRVVVRVVAPEAETVLYVPADDPDVAWPLVSVGSYCVVMDTLVEDMPPDLQPTSRPWGLGNNPKTAVWDYLEAHPEFEIDKGIQHKLLITVAPDGYLKRVR